MSVILYGKFYEDIRDARIFCKEGVRNRGAWGRETGFL